MSSEIPRHWRLKQQRYNLVGQKWGDQYVFPPRMVPPPVQAETLQKIDDEEKIELPIVLFEGIPVKTS